MSDDMELYDQFLLGDNEAFERLVARYGLKIIWFINGYVHNIDVAEELMEDTFCDLIFYKNRYQKRSLFKTYLFSIAKHKAIDYIRKNSRHQTIPYESCYNYVSNDSNILKEITKEDDKQYVYKGLGKLKEDYRSVLYLFYFENMSYAEIARTIGKTEKQVKNLLYNAKIVLKSVLESDGFKYEELFWMDWWY